MSGPPDPHLTPAQVSRILALVEERNAVVVGGQSLNIWAMYYRPDLPALAAFEPFTSRDIDFFGTLDAAEYLADQLGGKLLIPDLEHLTPSIALVVATLEGRRVEIDFLSHVLGVDWRRFNKSVVTIVGQVPGSQDTVRIALLHPVDCLRSRLANINQLGRHDEQSVNQAQAALLVVSAFANELLELGDRRPAQEVLAGLYRAGLKDFVGRPVSLQHGIDPRPILGGFLNDHRLDPRWRKYNLANWNNRLNCKFAAWEARQS